MTQYHVGDSLIRFKNAAMARHKDLVVINTKYVKAVFEALKRAGWVREIEEVSARELKIHIAYMHKEPVVMNLKLVSSPGLHVYMNVDELKLRKKSTTLILSTPNGVMSSKEAIKSNNAGEVIVEIW